MITALRQMYRASRLRSAWVVAVVVVMPAVSWGAVRVGDIEADARVPLNGEYTEHGYAAYELRLRNLSASQSHVVHLRMPDDDHGGTGDRLRAIYLRRIVEPGSAARVTLYQPPVPMYGSNVRISVDGVARSESLFLADLEHGTSSRWRYGGSSIPARVIVSQQLPFDEIAGEASSIFPGVGSNDSNRGPLFRADTFVSQWPRHWLGFTRFDGVMLTAHEMTSLPPETRQALDSYLKGGGTVVVVGGWTPPAAWQAHIRREAGLTSYFVGFGQCIVDPSGHADRWDSRQLELIGQAVMSTAQTLSVNDEVKTANQRFPIVDEITVPVRGMFVVMILFAVAIGPLNLIFLSRGPRRMWMLWTVPAISLLASGVVFGYSILSEGWSGHVRTSTLTLLDQTEHLAVTIGETAFYSPLTPSDGLHFSLDTELRPQTGEIMPWGGSGGRARSIDWTHDQHLSRGWVSARVPAHFRVRKIQKQRQRLVVRAADDGSVTALNSLGADITALHVADAAGRIYTADHIIAGREVQLKLSGQTSAGPHHAQVLRELFRITDTDDRCARLRKAPRRHLMPNTYIAVLSESPFLEDGLPSARERRYECVVYGLLPEASP